MKLTKQRLKEIIREELQNEDWATEKVPFSSKEAKNIMDSSLRDYAKDLRKVLGRDKIMNRFRKYFGGKKAMDNRTVKKGK